MARPRQTHCKKGHELTRNVAGRAHCPICFGPEYSAQHFQDVKSNPVDYAKRQKRVNELRRGRLYPAQAKRALEAAKRAKAAAERRIAKYEAIISTVS